MPRKHIETTMREALDRDDYRRGGHMWAIVTRQGLIVDIGELYGPKSVMKKRCDRWNRQHPYRPRWVVKVNMWWNAHARLTPLGAAEPAIRKGAAGFPWQAALPRR
jgi:hypothetical protein